MQTDTLEPIGAAVAIENQSFRNNEKSYSLQFVNDKNETGKPIYNEAEVTIPLWMK